MKKGEKSRFLAECLYCYGEMGVPPRIPRKARCELRCIQFFPRISYKVLCEFKCIKFFLKHSRKRDARYDVGCFCIN